MPLTRTCQGSSAPTTNAGPLRPSACRPFRPNRGRPGFATSARQQAPVNGPVQSSFPPAPSPTLDRRHALVGTFGVAAWQALQALAGPPARAATLYADEKDKFEISVPAGWAYGEGELEGAKGFTGASGTRRTVAFFPDDPTARDVSVSVVMTNVSVEFTKLGSFGNIDSFANNLVSSLDRSYLLKSRVPVTEPIQLVKLVDYSAPRGGEAYNVEYTIEKLPEPQRHLFSTVVLGNNGRYNRLYTVTAQCLEQDLPKYGATLNEMLKSFKADFEARF